MKNENAIMDRIKARIAYHANEHRHTYEIGKGVMDFLARDLLADFKAAGGLLPPVALDGDVYVIYRRKPVKAKIIFIGINADRLFFFNVLRGNIKANFQTYQFTENDIGRSVFLTLEEAEKAVARMKKKKSNLPKWKYDFSCKKCRHIQYIKDKAKRRDGDYCIKFIERTDARPSFPDSRWRRPCRPL